MKEIEFTGERIVPDKSPNDEWVRHTNRYKFATKHVKDKKVLDAACGTGYGSQMLLDAGAKEVIGVDISKGAVEYANERYKPKFFEMNVEKMKFKDDSFDVVVSFETIEHVENWKNFLKEVKRVLKPNGKIVLSVPNFSGTFLEKHRQKRWHYHNHFFTMEDTIGIFTKNFSNLKIYGQGKSYFAFPGRGIINKIFDIRRDHSIKSIDVMDYSPRTILLVGVMNDKVYHD